MNSREKKRICLITNWYPTEDNPEQGLFFREQAIMLSPYFNFVVLHYRIDTKPFAEEANVRIVKKEYNITEFFVQISFSRLRRKIYRVFSSKENYEDSLFKILFNKLEEEKIDCFYCISGQSEAALTRKIAVYFGKPYIVSEHGPVPWLDTVVSGDDKLAIEKADLLLAIGNDKLRQIMMQGIALPEYRYIGNLVDEDMFCFNPVKHDVKTFVAVGAYVFYKNYDMMIKVFERLSIICRIPFRLIIVGYKANKGYSKNTEELERKIKNSSFGGNVELIPRVPHEKMAEYYNRADAFVMTSVQEGQPVSALEAACCGLPVFSTRCGGVEDYVTDDMGRITEILDVEGFASALKDFLENRISFNAEQIRQVIINRFGKKAFTENMVNAFDSVMKKTDC